MLTNLPQNNSSSDTYGSGTTGGVGYGNKKSTSGGDGSYDNSNTRYGGGNDTAAYSGSGGYGSGTTGGAGYGNKGGNDDSNY